MNHAINTSEYIPGLCNIGPAERRQRRMAAIFATIATVLVFALLLVAHVSPWWRLLLFVPASAAASGYLQDAFHFCANFGMRGLYNVLNSAGTTETVDNDEFRQKDKRKARLIILLSAAIGAVVTVIAFIL